MTTENSEKLNGTLIQTSVQTPKQDLQSTSKNNPQEENQQEQTNETKFYDDSQLIKELKDIEQAIPLEKEIFRNKSDNFYKILFDMALQSNSKERRIKASRIICQLAYQNLEFQSIFINFGGLSLNKEIHLFTLTQAIKSSLLSDVKEAYEEDIQKNIINKDSKYWCYPKFSENPEVFQDLSKFKADPYFHIIGFQMQDSKYEKDQFQDVKLFAQKFKEKNQIKYTKIRTTQQSFNRSSIRSSSQANKPSSRLQSGQVSPNQRSPRSFQRSPKKKYTDIQDKIIVPIKNEEDSFLLDHKYQLNQQQIKEFQNTELASRIVQVKKEEEISTTEKMNQLKKRKEINNKLVKKIIGPGYQQQFQTEILSVLADNGDAKFRQKLLQEVDKSKSYLEESKFSSKKKKKENNSSYCSFNYKSDDQKKQSILKSQFESTCYGQIQQKEQQDKQKGIEKNIEENKILFNQLQCQAISQHRWSSTVSMNRMKTIKSKDYNEENYPKSPRQDTSDYIKHQKKSEKMDVQDYVKKKYLQKFVNNPNKVLLNDAIINYNLPDNTHRKLVLDIIKENKIIYGMKRREYNQIIDFRSSDRLDKDVEDFEEPQIIEDANLMVNLIIKKNQEYINKQKPKVKEVKIDIISEYFPMSPCKIQNSKLIMIDEEQQKKEELDRLMKAKQQSQNDEKQPTLKSQMKRR